ncbi:MAG TPA: DUF1365 domain-containing protein [Burkholderiaceae bacterium]|jgi:DUF1365 family protein|nr:DUF1365 domain-containing protein [Burkholderiaceae bacterium]
MNSALIGFGQVRHTRLRPVRNAFAYPGFFVLLPLRDLPREGTPGLPRNRFGLLAFHDRDHGDGREDCLQWLDELLASQGLGELRGAPVWLHTYPRVLGYAFKPVSFWYCHRADGSVGAIVVEVNNTFGERHCYLLDAGTSRGSIANGRELAADKVFHVSPFCEVRGRYRFRFIAGHAGTRERTVVRIDHDDENGPLLRTSVSGALEPLGPRSARRAFFAMPLMTLGVVARIHWQALLLWLKRVPFFRKPSPPDVFVSR